MRPGDLFLVRLPPGAAGPAEALFLGRRYRPIPLPGEGGRALLLGVDLAAEPGPAVLRLVFDGGRERQIPVEIAKRSFPEERLTLPPAMVTPPPEVEERIAREQAMAAEVYRSSSAAPLWEGGFSRPLPQPAAGNFGRRRVLNGIPKNPHAGEDYTAPAGTPVKAAAGGRARLCRDFYLSGHTVLVDHGAGLVSQYLHLEKVLVEEGATVRGGQEIGTVGSTGRATGPHLHFGLRLYEQRVDPELLWPLLGGRP